MKFRNLDPKTLDWTFGKGRQSFATDNQAIGLNVATSLRFFSGECFINRLIGLPWFQLLGLVNSPEAYYMIKSYIEAQFGVLKVNQIKLNVSEDRLFSLDLDITTLYDMNFQTTVVL